MQGDTQLPDTAAALRRRAADRGEQQRAGHGRPARKSGGRGLQPAARVPRRSLRLGLRDADEPDAGSGSPRVLLPRRPAGRDPGALRRQLHLQHAARSERLHHRRPGGVRRRPLGRGAEPAAAPAAQPSRGTRSTSGRRRTSRRSSRRSAAASTSSTSRGRSRRKAQLFAAAPRSRARAQRCSARTAVRPATFTVTGAYVSFFPVDYGRRASSRSTTLSTAGSGVLRAPTYAATQVDVNGVSRRAGTGRRRVRRSAPRSGGHNIAARSLGARTSDPLRRQRRHPRGTLRDLRIARRRLHPRRLARPQLVVRPTRGGPHDVCPPAMTRRRTFRRGSSRSRSSGARSPHLLVYVVVRTDSDWALFFELTVNGLTLGSVYALIALGYSMVYGILKLLNFAHGDVYMIGAFVGLRRADGARRAARTRSICRSVPLLLADVRRRRCSAAGVPRRRRSSASPTGRCGTPRGSRR